MEIYVYDYLNKFPMALLNCTLIQLSAVYMWQHVEVYKLLIIDEDRCSIDYVIKMHNFDDIC